MLSPPCRGGSETATQEDCEASKLHRTPALHLTVSERTQYNYEASAHLFACDYSERTWRSLL